MDFEMKKIDWLWRGWLALGKFHLLAGAKSAGKSTIVFDLMASITSAGKWPDGTDAPLGDVLVWSGEDDIRDTILPRFAAAGGDRKRIYFIRTIIKNDIARPFDPSADMLLLIERAATLPDLKLIMIDPVVLAIPSKADSHKNAETRRGLQPLVDFAETLNIALVGITHFTKGTFDQDPIDRVTGSLAFAALARVVLGTSADEDGHQRRLVRIASNIGPSGGGIEYILYQAPLPDRDFTAQCIAWGNILTGPPRDLLSGNKRSAQADASAFLTDFLKAGAAPANDVKAAAEAHGHAWATIRRAQVKLGIKPTQISKNNWTWKLPDAAASPPRSWTPD
jgi:putative DNA primase/helicase